MRTVPLHSRVACFVGAVALLVQMSPAFASNDSHHNRPVDITFTKWGAPPPSPLPLTFFGLFEGFAGDGLLGSFNAELLWRQVSVNGHLAGLEAMYEVVDGERSFTALIRGGQNAAGVGRLEGVIMAGWRTGARVQVMYQRYVAIPGVPSCEGAPINKMCFEGTIHVGRDPRD